MTRFFFEVEKPGASTETSAESAGLFFSALKDVGIIKESDFSEESVKSAEVLGAMSRLETKLVSVEYGTYQNNYAVHVTPTHHQRNLSDDASVKRALKALVLIMNEYVPYSVQVNLYLPRDDWKMKVISAVVTDGATAWNFDHHKFSLEAVPRIAAAVENVILGNV